MKSRGSNSLFEDFYVKEGHAEQLLWADPSKGFALSKSEIVYQGKIQKIVLEDGTVIHNAHCATSSSTMVKFKVKKGYEFAIG